MLDFRRFQSATVHSGKPFITNYTALRCCFWSRGVSWATIALLLVLSQQTAKATLLSSGWVSANVAGPIPGESAKIFENIVYDTIPGSNGVPNYDYIIDVANTGSVPIIGFVGGPGSPPVTSANLLYNSDTMFAAPGFPAAGPDITPMPKWITQQPPAGIPSLRGLAGGYGGANNPFAGSTPVSPYTPLYPSAPYLYSPDYKYWGFSVWSSNGGAGYLLRWYSLVGEQIFGPKKITRFDISSPDGPVSGGAMPDPFALPTEYQIDFSNGDVGSAIFPAMPDPQFNPCDPSLPDCYAYTLPTGITTLVNQGYTGYGSPVPEPAYTLLIGGGLLGLGLGRRSRKRRKRDQPFSNCA